MDHAGRIEAVERETAALAAALDAGPGDAPVPSCPGWTVAELAHHVGEFSAVWTHVLCEATGRTKTPYTERPDPGQGLGDWYRELSAYLVTELGHATAETPAWTWDPADQTVAFIARRCANELAIHRVDAELARGPAQPVEAELAADAIEETLFVIAPRTDEDAGGSGETLHLHGGGDGHEWLVTIGPERIEAERRHAKADLALRGATSDLALVVFGRPAAGPVERIGEESVLDAWYRAFTF